MSDDIKDTPALLGSRICHDLISPLGAISNGLELLAMSGIASSPEMTLIEDAIESANARVRFFRVAFGAATGSQILARSEILKLIEGCYGAGRISVRWDPPWDPSRTEVKIGLLAILCLESTLSHGGSIIVEASRGVWTFQSYGEKIRFEPELWAALQGRGAGEVSSAQVQFLLLRDALHLAGKTPQVGHSDSAVSLKI